MTANWRLEFSRLGGRESERGCPKPARPFDLEERTYQFALGVRHLLKNVPRTITTELDGKQLVRSSGSVGANYLEANECVSTRDFVYRLKICRKEARESRYWLNLLFIEQGTPLHLERLALADEADQLARIFGAIVRKKESAAAPPPAT